jgi:hypothetical protein
MEREAAAVAAVKRLQHKHHRKRAPSLGDVSRAAPIRPRMEPCQLVAQHRALRQGHFRHIINDGRYQVVWAGGAVVHSGEAGKGVGYFVSENAVSGFLIGGVDSRTVRCSARATSHSFSAPPFRVGARRAQISSKTGQNRR